MNGGSLAERAGLQVADAVIKVNGQDVYNLSHKGAQDAIVKAGSNVEIVLSRWVEQEQYQNNSVY